MLRTVTIVIPCRNEVHHIEKLLKSIYENDYDFDKIEILMVDGISDDGTRELIEDRLINQYSRLRLIDNVKQKTPYAFNIGIKESKGDIIIILGARHVISKNYISEIVKVLNSNEIIACVGGVVNNIYKNEKSEVISRAMGSSFGVGFGNFRLKDKDAFVDTVGSPAFRKSIFDEIGYFDERLTRNQDDDFSHRLIKHGYKILLKSNISIDYVVRANFDKLFNQYRQYGYWKVFVNTKHNTVTTLRQLFPAAFIISISTLLILSIFYSEFIYLLVFELVSYFILSLIFSFKDNGFGIRNLVRQVYACLILHVSYGSGYLEGIIDFIVFKRKPKSKNEQLSR